MEQNLHQSSRSNGRPALSQWLMECMDRKRWHKVGERTNSLKGAFEIAAAPRVRPMWFGQSMGLHQLKRMDYYSLRGHPKYKIYVSYVYYSLLVLVHI